MTDKKQYPFSHQWTQPTPFTSTWVRETPSLMVCPQPIQPVTPNPTFSNSATLQMFTPLKIKKLGSHTMLITISIPAESVITLPTKALEIKKIRNNLMITENCFFNCIPPVPGTPGDTPKLFLRGNVRKDIQYSEAVRQTTTAVEAVIKDFVIDIPISFVIDLGSRFLFPTIRYDQQQEYGFAKSPLSSGFSCKDQRLSSDTIEFNALSQKFYNSLLNCQLIFSQINEMDDALDRVPLHDGPPNESVFKTLQGKMIILIQLKLDFPPNHPPEHCKHHKIKK